MERIPAHAAQGAVTLTFYDPSVLWAHTPLSPWQALSSFLPQGLCKCSSPCLTPGSRLSASFILLMLPM